MPTSDQPAAAAPKARHLISSAGHPAAPAGSDADSSAGSAVRPRCAKRRCRRQLLIWQSTWKTTSTLPFDSFCLLDSQHTDKQLGPSNVPTMA